MSKLTTFNPVFQLLHSAMMGLCVRDFVIILLILFILRIFSGRFDTSGSMIARSVPEIHCTRKNVTEEEEELGILGSGLVALWKNHYFPPALI